MVSVELTHKAKSGGGVLDNYAHINFVGEYYLEKRLDTLFGLLVYDKCEMNRVKIDCLQNKIKEKNDVIESVNKDIEKLKKKYGLGLYIFAKDKIKSYKKIIAKAQREKQSLTAMVEELENDKYYGAREEKDKYKRMLNYMGFGCKTSYINNDGAACEIYESTIPDKNLMDKANDLYNQLRNDIDIKVEKIKKNYIRDVEWKLYLENKKQLEK